MFDLSQFISIESALEFVGYPKGREADELLTYLSPLSIGISFVIFCIGVALSKDNFVALWQRLTAFERKSFYALLVAAALFILFVPPRVNRIYFDEHIYASIGQAIAHTGRAVMCNDCDAEYGSYKIRAWEYNKEPNGHTFYLAMFFRLFGTSEAVAHYANNFAYIIATASVYFIALLLFSSTTAALFAGLLYALTPVTVLWSSTLAAEPSAAAFAALAILFTIIYRNNPSLSMGLALGGLITWAIQFRPESGLIAFPAALLLLPYLGTLITKLHFWILAITSAVLTISPCLHIYQVRHQNWGSEGDKFAWSIMSQNITVNGPFYFINERHPLLFTFLALVGLFCVTPNWKKLLVDKLALSTWFVLTWGIFLFFYAGSYNYGADIRFAVISIPPLAILAGLGASIIWNHKSEWTPSTLPRTMTMVFSALAIFTVKIWMLAHYSYWVTALAVISTVTVLAILVFTPLGSQLLHWMKNAIISPTLLQALGFATVVVVGISYYPFIEFSALFPPATHKDIRLTFFILLALTLVTGLTAVFAHCFKITEVTPSALPRTLLAVGLLVSTLSFFPYMRAITEEASEARFDIETAREFAKIVPDDSIILTHNPNMWQLMGKNSAQMSTATYNQQRVENELIAQYKGGVYYHRNAWCIYHSPTQNQFCTNIESKYRLETFAEQIRGGERYGLYRMHKK